MATFHDYLTRVAASEFCVVVDHVFELRAWYECTLEALRCRSTYVVAVRCEVEILEARERLRGDRKPGLSRSQHQRVHDSIFYDLEIDTGRQTPAECAEMILRRVNATPGGREPTVTTRPYVASDWPVVCRIFDAAKPVELAAGGVAESFCPLLADAERKKDFDSSVVWLAEQAGSVVGFIGYREHAIGWLFVDPACFRRGIGRRLLSCALEAIRGEAWLWTFEGNDAAISLYRSVGFEIEERLDTQNRGFPCRAVKMAMKKPRDLCA